LPVCKLECWTAFKIGKEAADMIILGKIDVTEHFSYEIAHLLLNCKVRLILQLDYVLNQLQRHFGLSVL